MGFQHPRNKQDGAKWNDKWIEVEPHTCKSTVPRSMIESLKDCSTQTECKPPIDAYCTYTYCTYHTAQTEVVYSRGYDYMYIHVHSCIKCVLIWWLCVHVCWPRTNRNNSRLKWYWYCTRISESNTKTDLFSTHKMYININPPDNCVEREQHVYM